MPQDRAPSQTGSRLTSGVVVDGGGEGAGVGVVLAGVLVVGAAGAAGGRGAGVVGSSAWLVRQPVKATLASSRTMARLRMGRMVVIPLRPAPAGRLVGSSRAGPAPGRCYGTYCSAIRTTWPSRTVIQNGGLLWVACITIASRHSGNRMSLVALPV